MPAEGSFLAHQNTVLPKMITSGKTHPLFTSSPQLPIANPYIPSLPPLPAIAAAVALRDATCFCVIRG